MTSWLDPLRSVLDVREPTTRFFFRDDDAGWDDDALSALLHTFEPHGLPVDVAVIPSATSAGTAELLRSRAATRNDVRVHQHGYAHVNHEGEGRKCEFGVSRSPEQQHDDIERGRTILDELFDDVQSVFTPPWNRCAPWTADVVRDLGFAVLSRDRTARMAGVAGLAEVPVTVDWFAKQRKVPVDRQGRGRLLAEAVAAHEPVGVMLHHAVMSSADRADLGDLLGLLATHLGATVHHLDRLAPGMVAP